jgi:hypothetical protein
MTSEDDDKLSPKANGRFIELTLRSSAIRDLLIKRE